MLYLSDQAGSAHMIPVADILAGCAEVAHAQASLADSIAWLENLDDDQIRAGGWTYPGPRLRAYLDSAIRVTPGPSLPRGR